MSYKLEDPSWSRKSEIEDDSLELICILSVFTFPAHFVYLDGCSVCCVDSIGPGPGGRVWRRVEDGTKAWCGKKLLAEYPIDIDRFFVCFFSLFCFTLCFWDRISLCSSNCLWTRFVPSKSWWASCLQSNLGLTRCVSPCPV